MCISPLCMSYIHLQLDTIACSSHIPETQNDQFHFHSSYIGRSLEALYKQKAKNLEVE